jgi:hypothetical protein
VRAANEAGAQIRQCLADTIRAETWVPAFAGTTMQVLVRPR